MVTALHTDASIARLAWPQANIVSSGAAAITPDQPNERVPHFTPLCASLAHAPPAPYRSNASNIRRFRPSPERNPAALGRICRDVTVNRASALDQAQCSARMHQAA